MKDLKMSIKSQKSTCMDCIFWYQCRHGNIDCSVKPRPTAGTAASI